VVSDRGAVTVFAALVAAGAVLSFGFPDLDIRLLGIRYHRYFLFHSAAAPVAVLLALRPGRRHGGVFAAAALAAAFALGVGAHLVTDTFQSKSVVFPFVGNLVRGTSLDDRLWEGANALVCGAVSWVGYGKWRSRRKRRAKET
jgi:hypothetical protein